MFGGFFKSFQLTMDRYIIESGQMGIKTRTFLGHLFPKKKSKQIPKPMVATGQQVSEHCKSRILLIIYFCPYFHVKQSSFFQPNLSGAPVVRRARLGL